MALGNKMQKRVIIVHGWEASPNSNWLPWLKSMLEARNISVSVPRMPDAANPKQDQWLRALSQSAKEPDENYFFVGHSLGCMAILRYLEGLKHEDKVGGAILVAGFTDDLGYKELGDFFIRPINWESINDHCKKFVVIASSNDEYVPLKHSDILKEKLNAKVLIQPRMGHFNIAELHVALNELLKLIG